MTVIISVEDLPKDAKGQVRDWFINLPEDVQSKFRMEFVDEEEEPIEADDTYLVEFVADSNTDPKMLHAFADSLFADAGWHNAGYDDEADVYIDYDEAARPDPHRFDEWS